MSAQSEVKTNLQCGKEKRGWGLGAHEERKEDGKGFKTRKNYFSKALTSILIPHGKFKVRILNLYLMSFVLIESIIIFSVFEIIDFSQED